METVYNWLMNITADDYARLRVLGVIAGVALLPVALLLAVVNAYLDAKVKRERRERLFRSLRR